jgi:hypothetical protein
LVVAHAVDDVVVLEIHTELAVIPAGNRWAADGTVFLIGQAETLKYRALSTSLQISILKNAYTISDF